MYIQPETNPDQGLQRDLNLGQPRAYKPNTLTTGPRLPVFRFLEVYFPFYYQFYMCKKKYSKVLNNSKVVKRKQFFLFKYALFNLL